MKNFIVILTIIFVPTSIAFSQTANKTERQIVQYAKKANVPVTFYTAKGGHGDFNDTQIRRLVTEFLTKYPQKK
ncbi:MAG: hypothetical protein H0X72_17875 [Acidobacteria bacterium]|jgi:uncharacterized alpha/beta hydrolase family protein|nr:hypothetical protein [Acidobacteriota bacterium]MBA4183041.1 hypothetical protein [Acidobacteriota bacterium]